MTAQNSPEIVFGPLDTEQTIQHYQGLALDDAREKFGTDQINLGQFKTLRVEYLTAEHKYSRQAIQFLSSGLIEAWGRDSQIANELVWKAYGLETLHPEFIEALRTEQYSQAI